MMQSHRQSEFCKLMRVDFLHYNSCYSQPIAVGGSVIESVESFKLLGVYISSDLSWSTHCDYIIKKSNRRLYALRKLKADTHEGFCPRSMLQDHFARVSTHEGALFAPGACSQVFNRLNIVEYFAGWKFCSRGLSIPMKSLVHTLCFALLCFALLPERAPGACSGSKTPRVYRPS